MGMFFERLSGVVLDREVVMPSAVERAVGMCTAFGHPEAIGSPPVPVDCRGAEGCLFCEHFKVHADERDTRKLISCRYCIQQTALAGSQERLALFGPIFDRIGAILSEVGKRAPGIVEQLERRSSRTETWTRIGPGSLRCCSIWSWSHENADCYSS